MFARSLLTLALIAAPQFAQAASTSGNAALALAALVAQHSPSVSALNKWRLRHYLNGHRAGPGAPATIHVNAGTVHCRISNVDVTSHHCDFSFGASHPTLAGRAAHELYATMLENGASPEGAAGSMHVEFSHLACVIKPHEFGGGGGADCSTTP